MYNRDNFFKILNERGISNKELSSAIGVSSGNVSDWKSGKSKPNIDAISNIADYLGCSTDYLLGRESDRDSDFYSILLSPNGINVIKTYLKSILTDEKYKILNDTLGLSFNDIRQFLNLDIVYGRKCLSVLDKILITLDLNLHDIFKEYFQAESNRSVEARLELPLAARSGENKIVKLSEDETKEAENLIRDEYPELL